MSWEMVKLGDLYEVHNGLSKGGKFFGSGFPFLSFSTVFNNWFLPETLPDLVQSTEKEQTSYSILRGDVFITRTSETMDELGMSSVALKDYPNATYNGFTKRLRPVDNSLLPEFIGYYFRSKEFRNKFMAFSTMTTRASLRNEDLLSLEVPVPELCIQHRIADILSAYDDLIENNRKQIKLLEEAARRLYKEWFVDLRFPGYEHTKITDGVPEGWEKRTVGSLIDKPIRTKQIPTADYQTDGMIPVIDQSREFISGYTNDTESLVQSNVPVIVFGDHTRILKLIQFPFAKGADGTQLICSSSNHMPQRLLYCSLLNIDLSNYHYARHFKYLKAEVIFVPTVEIANLFESIAEPLYTKVQRCREICYQAQQARDRLLPKLMTGEVEV